MRHQPPPSGDLAAQAGRAAMLRRAPLTVALAAILCLAPFARRGAVIDVPPPAPVVALADTASGLRLAEPEADPAVIAAESDLVDAERWAPPKLGWEPRGLAGADAFTFALRTAFADADAILAEAPVEEGARIAQVVPLPVPRPSEFRRIDPAFAQRRSERLALRRQEAAPSPAQVEDTRNFFEKLFGVEKPASPVLAYAALDNSAAESAARRRVVPPPAPVIDAATAVYDISARSVVLPNGDKLEAHSGLGEHMDDPRFVHVRMRGATPPGTYDLTEREAPFHGVRAIRLSPVGGSEAVHGRVGLLAHTYMLGPSGASNGCVSFREYDRFLQAYLRGEIRRLVVVAGAKQTSAPLLALR